MVNIFHFVNHEYGLPFIKFYYTCDPAILSNVSITFVFSGKGSKIENLLKLGKTRMLFFYRHGFKLMTTASWCLTDNVNSNRFAQKTPKGSHAICSGFNQIFRKRTIKSFKSFVNFHPSLLPFYRGPVPSKWCLKNEEKFSGFTLHMLTDRIDCGEILYQEAEPIKDGDTEPVLDKRIAKRAVSALDMYLRELVLAELFFKKILNAELFYENKVGYKSFC